MRVEPGNALTAEVAGPEIVHARPDSARTSPRRVLIVEDDQSLAENLCEIVEMLGYDACAVPSAEAALVEIVQEHVEFIVTDHRLSGMSGAALLLAVRSLGKRIPAVITTAWVADEPIGTAWHSGMTEVMSKPMDIEGLLWVLRKTLGPPPVRSR